MSILLKSMQRYEEIFDFFSFYAYLTLTLTQFELRVLLLDYKKTTIATNDLAIVIASFD